MGTGLKPQLQNNRKNIIFVKCIHMEKYVQYSIKWT